MAISSRLLTREKSCPKRRARNIELVPGRKGELRYEKAVIVKQIIKDAVTSGTFDEKAAREKLDDLFVNELDYPTETTAKLLAEDNFKYIKRYVSCETRKPLMDATTKVVSPFGLMDVTVRPDFIFLCDKNFEVKERIGRRTETYTERRRCLEVVKIKASKPTVTQGGKKFDSSVNSRLELYVMLLYAREVAKALKEEGIMVSASYYYLRKNTDSFKNGIFNPDFFDGKGGNVVSLDDVYTSYFPKTPVDDIFYPQFKEYVDGVTDCEKKNCEHCDFYRVCNFTAPPIASPDPKSRKELTDILLTEAQEEAINFTKGICRINAGAGAGKTMVIAFRTAIMLSCGVKPEDILLVTFTNAGARELLERIELYCEDLGVDADLSKLTVVTFNGFGYDIIKRHYADLHFKKAPQMLETIEKAKMISGLLKKKKIAGLDYRNFETNMPSCMGALAVTMKVFDVIKRGRYGKADIDAIYDEADPSGAFLPYSSVEELVDLYNEFEDICFDRCVIEYADQELLLEDLLKVNPFYFEENPYKHVIVDEFQDTSPIQFRLLQQIIDSPAFESFMIVGDDSQAIYSFRGTTPEFIVEFFDKLGEEGTDIFLLQNHRSTPQIIEFANKLNALNPVRVAKDLVATRPDGKGVEVQGFHKQEEEYQFIVKRIKEKIDEGADPSDICFEAYTRAELLKMASALALAGIPSVMLNPEPMMDNCRVLAALDLASVFKDTTDSASAFMYLNTKEKNSLLDKTDSEVTTDIDEFTKLILYIKTLDEEEKKKELDKLLDALDDDDEVYEKFVEDIRRRESFAERLEYIEDFRRFGEKECVKRNGNYPGVALTTAHSGKGLEWKYVFNSISKYFRTGMHTVFQTDEVMEKRRLFFVSATRARDELVITGQYISGGSKAKGTTTYNGFLREAYDILGMEFNPNHAPSVA